jgi:hypothetical protein
MAFHLEGPWLSTTGKRKGKQKFRNAEEARKARELEDNWKDLQKKWGIEVEEKKRKRAMTASTLKVSKPNYRGADQPKIPSLNTGWHTCAKKDTQMYTGTKVKGIGTMHKSNAVPIFSDEEAVEISKMRR